MEKEEKDKKVKDPGTKGGGDPLPADYDQFVKAQSGLNYWKWKALKKKKHAPLKKDPPKPIVHVDPLPIVVLPKKPQPPPSHVITPWKPPVHDHVIHGPLPGSQSSSSNIMMHHDPEPAVYEDSAPANIPMGGQAMRNVPHVPKE